jgi:hypothetical protein
MRAPGVIGSTKITAILTLQPGHSTTGNASNISPRF